MRVVLDTNVCVSGIITPTGPPGRILDLWRQGRFTLCFSAATLAEIDDVLGREEVARYFRRPPAWIAEFTVDLRQHALVVEPAPVNTIDEDPPDNLVLGTAVAAFADSLVSGDRHLLALGSYRGIPIVPRRRFLDLLERTA
jgi:putative PIN family toxin of toxin-antitoxin system